MTHELVLALGASALLVWSLPDGLVILLMSALIMHSPRARAAVLTLAEWCEQWESHGEKHGAGREPNRKRRAAAAAAVPPSVHPHRRTESLTSAVWRRVARVYAQETVS